jgi:hypothetical protein
MGGSWLPPDFNLAAFELFASVIGSAEWLTVEHPVATLFAAGALMGWKIRKTLFA